MTLEQALIAGITAVVGALGSVVGALCYVCKLMWTEAKECKKDRISLRLRIERMGLQLGTARGTLRAYQSCTNGDCPFAERNDDGDNDGAPDECDPPYSPHHHG